VIASNARSGPIPLPLGVGVMLGEMVVLSRGWGSAGWVLRSQGSSEGSALALRAQSSVVRFQSSLRPHPAPPAYRLLGMGPALAGKL
jgi:hypothetical protein